MHPNDASTTPRFRRNLADSSTTPTYSTAKAASAWLVMSRIKTAIAMALVTTARARDLTIVGGVAVYPIWFCSVRMSRLAKDLRAVLVSRSGRHFALGQSDKLTLPVRERRGSSRWLCTASHPFYRIGSLSRSTLRVKRQQRSVGETEHMPQAEQTTSGAGTRWPFPSPSLPAWQLADSHQAIAPAGWRQAANSEHLVIVQTTKRSLILARNGHGGAVTACLLLEAKQKTSALSEYFAV
jgi:hypothetical protein